MASNYTSIPSSQAGEKCLDSWWFYKAAMVLIDVLPEMGVFTPESTNFP